MVGRKRSVSLLAIASRPSEALLAERNQHGRPDLAALAAEEVVALRVADLAAARPCRLEERFEDLQFGAAAGHDAHVRVVQSRRATRAAGSTASSTQREAPKSSRNDVSSAAMHAGCVARPQQPPRQPVHAIDDGVVGAAVFDQLEQFLLERAVLFAQHEHLALDERHRRAAALVRQLQPREHAAVTLEEVGMGDQELGDLLFGQQGSLDAADRFIHST